MKLTAALIAVLVAASYTVACSCMAPPPPAQAMEKSAAVFSGKVTKIERDREFNQTVTLTVDRSWKGIDTETVVVKTNAGGGDCGYGFKDGESYLIYAYRAGEKEDGELSTNICTRTKLVSQAKEDLDALGEGKKIEGKK